MIRHGLLLGLMLAAATSAQAQQWKPIDRKDSRLDLELPEFASHRSTFSFAQTADYSVNRYLAARLPNAGRFPRMEVILDEVAPGRYWSTQREIDEGTLRTWRFLKDRQIADLTPAAGGGNERLRIAPFRVENVSCFAFEAFVGNPGVRHGYSDLESRQRASGYYCGPVGAQLGDAAIAHALSAVRVLNPHNVATLPGSQP
jgi:hypothetical protein